MEKVEALYNKWKDLQPLTEQKQYLFSQRFTVEYNYNSNHIEGNTLTYGPDRTVITIWKSQRRRRIERFCRYEGKSCGNENDADGVSYS